jgi:hypothetical protein
VLGNGGSCWVKECTIEKISRNIKQSFYVLMTSILISNWGQDMDLKRKRKIAILIILNIIIIGILGWFILRGSLSIKYVEFENYPEPLYVTRGGYPYLYKTQNGSLFLLFSKFNRISGQENASVEIYLVSSENGQDWNQVIQITNDTYDNKWPKIIQQNNDTFRVYYLSTTEYRTNNWKYIESQNLINWTKPIISVDPPIDNQYWSDINCPPYFEQAKEYRDHYSLIRNRNGTYIFAGIHDISSSVDEIRTKLFIMTSDNGKDWDLPILISKKYCYHYTQSIIEYEDGKYFIAFRSTDNRKDSIEIISFSDSDLENTSEPITVYESMGIVCFLFILIIIGIIDIMMIRSTFIRKFEWIKYNPNQAKDSILIITCIISIIFVLFLLFTYLPWAYASNAGPYFPLIIMIIILIIFMIITFIIWKNETKRIPLFHESYSITITHKINTSKIINSLENYLDENKIEYIFNPKKYRTGSFRISFHRKDNHQSFIEIWGGINKINIIIFSNEFVNKKHIEPIKKLIWDDKSKR